MLQYRTHPASQDAGCSLFQFVQAFHKGLHSRGVVFVFLIRRVNTATCVFGIYGIEIDVIRVSGVDISHQCVTDNGGSSAQFNVRIEGGQPVQLKKDGRRKGGLLKNMIGDFSSVVVTIH